MYFEEAEVKEYSSTNKKTGVTRTNFQINIKKGSKYRKAMKIGLVDLSEIKEISESLDLNKLNEIKGTLEETSEELVELKQQLKQLKEEKVQLQEQLLESNNELLETKSKLENLQEETKEEIAELNFKLNNEKDLNKALLIVRSDFLKQGRIKAFFKIEPESSKKVAKLKELPEDIETTISKD